MRRERLRRAYTAEELQRRYPQPHEHFGNHDHRVRVAVTIQIAKALAGNAESSADLSCGDAAILCAVPAKKRYFGDFAPGWPIVGPIESTIDHIPHVDLFICCETVEHLDDPDTVLKSIRDKTDALVLSTPVGCFHDQNPEHYWAWDREAIEQMLDAARFTPVLYASVDFRMHGPDHYEFAIFGCR